MSILTSWRRTIAIQRRIRKVHKLISRNKLWLLHFDLNMSPASKSVGGHGRRSWMWLLLLTVAASLSHLAQASAQFAWTNIQTSVTRGKILIFFCLTMFASDYDPDQCKNLVCYADKEKEFRVTYKFVLKLKFIYCWWNENLRPKILCYSNITK